MAISMDGSDPATWDPALDGVLAAPENHQVLYEDDVIRVISVTIARRDREAAPPSAPLGVRHRPHGEAARLQRRDP